MPALRIVAAGRGRTMSHPKIVEAVMNLVVSGPRPANADQKPKLVYLGTATYDREEPFDAQTVGYASLCEVMRLDVSEATEFIPARAEIQQTIDSAQIILVSGGNTLYAVQRWKALGIDEMITKASEQGVVLCGGSAGAICWFEEGHSDSMDPTTFLNVNPNLTDEQKKDWKYVRVQGLGFLPALCVPHHDATQSNGLPRALDSDAMMLEKPLQPCFGIDENAALVVEGDTTWVVSADGIAKCCLKRCEPGEEGGYSILEKGFDASTGSIPLSNLWQGLF
jgi:dipeptidase E